MTERKRREKIRIAEKIPAIELLLVLIGFGVIMGQAVYAAYHIEPTPDEGLYAYKGYQFVSGRYEPYQEYGFWMNKVPLSFLIPGAAQFLFGTGLRTSRYFALFLFMIMLIGVWWAARRFGGKWLAVGILVFIAFNSRFIEVYSQGLSQGVIASMLTWSLALTLGKDRKRWQLCLGGILAGFIPVTRENMIPFLVLWMIYLVWENGIRTAWPALLAAAVAMGLELAIYWPEIVWNWLRWIPDHWFSFLDPIRSRIPAAEKLPWLSPSSFVRFYVFWHAIYLQFAFWVGVCLSWLFWPGRKNREFARFHKAALFLSLLLIILTGMHAYASIMGSYCTFCFENYNGFYAPVGWMLIAITFPYWQKKLTVWRQVLVVMVVVLLSAGYGFGSAPATGPFLLNIQVPRMQNMRILPGTIELWNFLYNKYGWSVDFQKYLLPSLTGFAGGLLLVLLAFFIKVLRRKCSFPSAAYTGGIFVLAAAMLAAPFLYLDSVTYFNPCPGNVIAAHERVGDDLARVIPAGALVYWQGALVVDMLYLPGANVFPAQLNQAYSLRVGGDSDALSKYGLWNQELADQWLLEADYLVLDETAFQGQTGQTALDLGYKQAAITRPYELCRETSGLIILAHDQP